MLARVDERENLPGPIVLWIVGEPGVGKTTLARKILLDYGPPNAVVRRPKWTVFGWYAKSEAAAVGTWEGRPFDGGDTVPIGDIKPALTYYADHLADDLPLVVFDGDKFANANAVEYVRATAPGSQLVCLHLVGPEDAAAGRLARSQVTGKTQDDTWVRGRRTKSARFAEGFPGLVLTYTREEIATAAGFPTTWCGGCLALSEDGGDHDCVYVDANPV